MIKLNSIKNGILYTYILLLAGCGGGNGGGTSVVEDPGSPVQSVAITLTTTSLNNYLSAGDEIPVTLKGSWTGKNLGTDKVYLQARDVEGRFTTPLSFDGALGSEFSFSFLTQATLVAGTHNGAIEVRACKDAKCAKPYSKSSESIDYTLNVALVTDWETHQRDANHRGYIPILLNPEKFKKVWQWQREPDASDPIGGINAVVTSNGKVYITTDVYFGQGILYALNEIDGTEAWRVSFGKVPALNPPAVSQGAVYAATTGHQDTFLWAFNAGTGKFKHKSAFSGQWPHVLAPTVYGDQVYTGGGYYGGDTYSFSTVDGSNTWTHSAGGAWDMYTPAVDEKYVYHHNGNALFLIDRTTGTSTSIIDPFGAITTYDYHGAPIIGMRNNVISFAGGALSGRASSSTEQRDERVLSSFNIVTKSHEWSSSYSYLTVPAVANGVIYAARNGTMSLDAFDETTGDVLWSWTPTGNGDTSFHRNIIVTNNLLFVSTDKTVYALDLATKLPVWSYSMPGMLAISADRTLYINTGATVSDGGLVAIKLN